MTIPQGLRKFVRRSSLARPFYNSYRCVRKALHARRLVDFLARSRYCPPEQARAIASDWRAIADHTQLSWSGILNLETACRYVIANRLEGAFVECGTWRGGALAYWARAMLRNGATPAGNPIFGFDSFQGMPRITDEDGSWAAQQLYGQPFEALAAVQLDGSLTPHAMNQADETDCRRLAADSGFPAAHTHIVKGWFQDTLPLWKERIGRIAVLRLDGDWYESTRICLEQLYDLVVPGGIVIIDDYGFFVGCRKAIDEFFLARGQPIKLFEADVCVRYLVKDSWLPPRPSAAR